MFGYTGYIHQRNPLGDATASAASTWSAFDDGRDLTASSHHTIHHHNHAQRGWRRGYSRQPRGRRRALRMNPFRSNRRQANRSGRVSGAVATGAGGGKRIRHSTFGPHNAVRLYNLARTMPCIHDLTCTWCAHHRLHSYPTLLYLHSLHQTAVAVGLGLVGASRHRSIYITHTHTHMLSLIMVGALSV